MERWVKEAFSVIGRMGSTAEDPQIVPILWKVANKRFPEVEALAKRNPDGSLAGMWGCMSDLSRAFRPWEENFTKGLYLAGVECRSDAQPPSGWTRWDVPAFEYIRVETDGPDTFRRTLDWMRDQAIPLVAAVQDYTDPATGKSYMCFPVKKLDYLATAPKKPDSHTKEEMR